MKHFSKESNYYKSITHYKKLENQQKDFINKFFKEKGIDSDLFLIRGNGLVNQPFKKNDDITLYIVPTKNDLENFEKFLCKPIDNDLRAFKQNCKINKDFAEKCIKEEIPINLYFPRISDEFKNLSSCKYNVFEADGLLFAKIESEYLQENDTPLGFIEIKASKYYSIKENLNKKEV